MGLFAGLKDRAYNKNVSNLYAETKDNLVMSSRSRGHSPLTRSKINETIGKIDKQLEKYPDDSVLYLLKATLHNERREYEEALLDLKYVKTDEDVLEKVSKIQKHIGSNFKLKKDFYDQRRISEFNLGNHDDASKYFIFRLFGDDVPEEILENGELQHYIKGFMFEEGRDQENAEKEYKELLNMSPELDSDSLLKLAEVPEDIPIIRYLTKKDSFHTKYAKIESSLGNFNTAVRHFGKALEINPENKEAQKWLRHLETYDLSKYEN